MNENRALREHLIVLLEGRQAHVSAEDALRDFPAALQGSKPEGAAHTPWQLLEHMRIAAWDILEFSRDPGHVSPEFPDGCWPESETPPDAAAWESSLKRFSSDLEAMKALVSDPSTDLFAPIPGGTGQTLLREAMLVADHNAYHVAQVVQLRKMMQQGKKR
jgi:DinB superfamily